MLYAEVAVDFPDDRARTFSYSVPAGMDILPGDLVTVPFGPGELNGIVFSTGDTAPVEQTRPVTGRLPGGPFVSPHHLQLARWISGYYRTTLFTAAGPMLPPGVLLRSHTWLSVRREGPQPPAGLNESELRAWTLVDATARARKDRVIRKLGRSGEAIVERLIRNGTFSAVADAGRPTTRSRFADMVVLGVPAEQALIESRAMSGPRDRRRADLLAWLAAGNPPETRAATARRAGLAAVKRLTEAGLLRIERRQVYRDPLAEFVIQQSFSHELSGQQSRALEPIAKAIANPRSGASHSKFLLFGVTGSGKTEVYVRAVDLCIKSGGKAIVLVPEIAMTPQILRQFASRFPGKVALQHSGLSPGERLDQWNRIRAGDFDIVLGPRSAIFAPVPGLRLVVIDEEHEWTYKQVDQAPRYHAREVAERVCAEVGAVLVCGSATPSVETFREAERKEYALLELPHKVSAATTEAARVEVVDMKEELRAGRTGVLSQQLLSAMREAFAAGGNVILFLNRRGVASFIQCRECGTVRKCRRCDTSLTYHRPARRAVGHLLCHYCGYTARSARVCPECGGVQMLRVGAGTQAVADAVEANFPRAGVLRWDSDSARSAREHTEILEQFERGHSRVLVGTQLVAKGLDVPSVTLAGIVSADVGLAVPDFRSSERTFQLLTQAAGRAGRGSKRGRVVIQTLQPDHYAVEAAARLDYDSFYRAELAIRSKYALPPFTRLIRLLYQSPLQDEAAKYTGELAARLKHERIVTGDTANDVLGPTPAYPMRVRGRFRWQVILRGPSPEGLLDRVQPGRGWTVDVDPASIA